MWTPCPPDFVVGPHLFRGRGEYLLPNSEPPGLLLGSQHAGSQVRELGVVEGILGNMVISGRKP